MGIFLIAFIIVLIIICLLLIVSVLLQEDKSGGGLGILGGSSQSFFGVSSGSFLAKATSILLVIFFLSAVTIAILASISGAPITKSAIEKTEYTEANVQVTEINKVIQEEEQKEDSLKNQDQTNDTDSVE